MAKSTKRGSTVSKSKPGAVKSKVVKSTPKKVRNVRLVEVESVDAVDVPVEAPVEQAPVEAVPAVDDAEAADEVEDDFVGFASEPDSDSDSQENLDDGFESTDDEETVPEKTSNDISEKEIKSKIDQALSKKSKQPKQKPGVVYIGRIPHGFYEEQMKSYFSQFGTITRLRLSRNKKTGRSKHYAFIEFESNDVARIVSETMDNYLLFGHILKVKHVPAENVHEELFVGANKTFKAIPWARIAKHRNDEKKTKEAWEQLQENNDKRRQEKAKRLEELGIDYKYEDEEVAKEKPKPKTKSKAKSAPKKKSKA